ncbi:hypothetical protein [Thiomicrorhabdus sp. 6S3-12]|uniref:hypothetical protein n=1 Tax=Thiomicrorhabdus sp. 6S3-12 TaxID=2819681 RepID=UPI001AAE16A9|nr:hypothetical protein [Thiomicrorhabdus sp. 6S3-12]MBO1924961.1 hypothetical protein [Thiomicrorhabdus sp. 6S3-12]
MDFEFIVKMVSTVSVAVIGWIVAHYFTSRRDMANKRREIQTQYLIDAYRKIDGAIEPVQFSKEWCESLQSSFSDIQLFGTNQQIELAHEFAEILLTQEKINQNILKSLLHDLRADLRSELGLESTDSSIGHIRIHETKNT